MKLRTLAVAGAATLALAGCSGGGSSDQPTPTSGGGDATHQYLLQAAGCMRNHGYPDWPEPIRDERGNWGWPDSVPDVTAPAECADLMRSAKGAQHPSRRPKSAEEMTQLRKWAECVRSHGVPNWPDPNADGNFDQPAELQPLENNDTFNAAGAACESLEPAGGVGFNLPPGATKPSH